MPARKILILGLDALPWAVVRPMMAGGHTPFLAQLAREGCAGTLRSTVPHQTPAAWTTFMTGVQPGVHGVLNWQRYDVAANELGLNNVERVAGKSIYRRFTAAGMRTGVVMQPATYPPFELSGGFLLSGFDSPGIEAPFAAPRELEAEILRLCPDHARNFESGEEWDDAGHATDDAVFAKNIAWLGERSLRISALACELFKAHPVDVFKVYFQDPDLLLHRAWKWCEPDGAGARENPARHAAVCAFFRDLDTACRNIWEIFRAAAVAETGAEPLVMVVSDHGQHEDKIRVRLNTILTEMGWLVPASGISLLKDGARRVADRLGRRKPVGFGVPIDWNRTRAFMPYQSCTGFVYLNVQGRQPHGSLSQSQVAVERQRLAQELRAYRDPVTGQSYFAEVVEMTPENGWDPRLSPPDVYVQPATGVEFVRRIKKGERFYPAKRPYAGIHHPDGMYILHGPEVAAHPGEGPWAQLADMAPTLLAAAGMPVPSYMQGRALAEVFAPPLEVLPLSEAWDAEQAGDAYSAEQTAIVEKRLADLGYLD